VTRIKGLVGPNQKPWRLNLRYIWPSKPHGASGPAFRRKPAQPGPMGLEPTTQLRGPLVLAPKATELGKEVEGRPRLMKEFE
jgi:hypothetical protein